MVRHHPQWQWIKKYIKSGHIGKCQIFRQSFLIQTKSKNIRNILKYGGGAVYDIGCYPTAIEIY